MRSLLLIFCVCFTGSVHAHDFWIEPSTFTPATGEVVQVALRVGEHFDGKPVPRNPELIKSFTITGPDGTREVPGLQGRDPAGIARPWTNGAFIIAYQSQPTPHVMEAKPFEDYLWMEGLTDVIAVREENGQQQAPGRELFSRCAKSFIHTDSDGQPLAEVGLRLEIMPTAEHGRFLVHLEGRGQEGLLVRAMTKEEPTRVLSEKTDTEGSVTLSLDRPGTWLLKTVHMVPAPDPGVADWESIWASLTFRLDR